MAEQLFLFSGLIDAPPATRQKQLTAPKMPAQTKGTQRLPISSTPPTNKQRAELEHLRQRNSVLTSQVAELENRFDEAWCVFHRRLDHLPDDGRGSRAFAARFLIDVVRDIHNPNTDPEERTMACRWLKGEDVGGVVSAQEMCAFAGVEHSRIRGDLGRTLIESDGQPRPRIRRL